MTYLDEIKSQKYISLETYRKNNQPINTPVWFVIKNDLIYVVTRSQTGKVKRLKNNNQVKIATCTIKGKITGEQVAGIATILNDEETKDAVKWRDQKYGLMAKIAKFFSKSKGEFCAFSIKIN
ncbi:MAG: PPOX class F420-dependent oxidoreductase [Nitrosopumilus sp.]|uniref:PPOX class F420-dependent oxidoreductase n=1 Tax=Nitrosopumilus sp. TaxID=2024843 RepID=UPI00247C384D|nr:PPOX class F420-dependent oxidoreductase [Nitrosopumilus sp.]MCV0392517.1 PPOX class F420-dependent oxidoreductase [Nitrosopumilus sp.]